VASGRSSGFRKEKWLQAEKEKRGYTEEKHIVSVRELLPWLSSRGFDGAMCFEPWFGLTFEFPSPNNTNTIAFVIDVCLQR
jgi:hypothetical protein